MGQWVNMSAMGLWPRLRIVVIGHDLVDPGHEALYVRVDSGQVLPSAADAPGHETDERLPTVHGQG